MSNVKKAFAPIVDFLSAKENQTKTVAQILAQVTELASGKATRGVSSAMIKDADGKTVAIHDYYFKRWMPVVGSKAVDVGVKPSTPSGFNSMSKAGVNAWTKQQREAKLAGEKLLADVVAGTVKPADIIKAQEAIEAKRKEIVPTELGFATEEEVRKYLVAEKVKLA